MLFLCVLLLVRSAPAQYETTGEDPVESRTPLEGEACGYESCLPIKPGWLNVHIVPQTHSELGHGHNFDQHYTGEDGLLVRNNLNMKRILDAVLTELWQDPRRRFTFSDTAYLFQWWNQRHPAVHDMMYRLVRQGRLTIAGGGLGISDEASISYHSIIDQFTYSLRKLNETFLSCARPLVAWAVDVYGHSKEFTSLMAQMGFDALFINPISYDDEAARMRRQALEFVWRGSDDLGAVTDMFTHNLFDGYWSPPGFCFSQMCSDPRLVTKDDSPYMLNIDERVDKFIEAVLYRQAPNYGTKNIMVVMGHRKAYFDARVWFENIEKLMMHTNLRSHEKRLNVTVFYSNPACYLMAVHDENPELETKQDDFFPYVHDLDSYTVGMYTSRPTLKFLIREAHVYLQMAKQLQVTANMNKHNQLIEEFNWVMGVSQDHSVATGVLRQSVKDYYVEKLVAAIQNSTEMASLAFTKLRESPTHIPYVRCELNISSCRGTRYTKFTIQVYNPLAWRVTAPVRLPVYPAHNKYKVFDATGAEVKSEKVKLSDAVLDISGRPKADYELVFLASNLPPVGFRSYYIESQFFKIKAVKRVKMDEMNKYFLNVPTDKSPENKQLDGFDKKTPYKEMYVDKIEGTNMRRFNTKQNIKVLGDNTDDNEIENKRTMWSKRSFLVNTNKTSKPVINLDSLTTNHRRNVLQEETEAEPGTLPMLRDYLQKQNILGKSDFLDDEDLAAPSDELFVKVPTTAESERPYAIYTSPSEISAPFRNSDIIPTIDIDVPVTKDATDRDIQIAFKERATLKPAKKLSQSSDIVKAKVPAPIQMTSTEPDIVIRKHETKELDIKIPARKKVSKPITESHNKTQPESDVPVRTTTSQRPTRITSVEFETKNTESLKIVPVRTTERIVPITRQSILVVPVQRTTQSSLMAEPLGNTTAYSTTDLNVIKKEQNVIMTADFLSKLPILPLKEDEVKSARKHVPVRPERFNIHNSVDTNKGNVDKLETDTHSKRLSIFQEVLTTEETSTAIETNIDDAPNTADYIEPIANDDLSVLAKDAPKVTTTEKYFKVEDGSDLFIGNKYVRVNLDDKRRLTSVFLSNGLRINLRIQMFYYISDDPESLDLRPVPRRTIKPPGAYIFRPLDPRIITLRTDYQVKIIKTSVVEEIQMQFNEWASLVLRLYVDSPVIEVQWLVGPIPDDSNKGKDVFVRYSTDLDHSGEFYTDSNGRQTIKRIRGLRATYSPLNFNPITGNLYPVTSKIHIEDQKKNIRFAVFNDRCQAGGSLVDGAIDLMLHRRILTDDIGFGAYLNETEEEKGIRVIGTHYLYVTKANKNRIFEKKFAKEIAMAPRVLTSAELSYSDKMKKEFYELKNEFSALREKLPVGVHLLTLERLSNVELLLRLENYLEKADVRHGVRYVALRKLFVGITVVWLKETTLAGNIFKDQWAPAKWRTKSHFYKSFNEYYGTANIKYDDEADRVRDELGGRGVRLAPQQIRTFIVKYVYT